MKSRLFGVVAVLAALLLPGAKQGCCDRPQAEHSLGSSVSEPWGVETEGLQMSLCTEKTQCFSGELVVLKAVIRNLTKTTRGLTFVGDPISEFSIEVKDSNGNGMPLTLWGKNLPKHDRSAFFSPHSMPIIVWIPGGGETYFQFVLNRQFDLSLVGRYSIAVKYFIFTGTHKSPEPQLVSNKVDIDIAGQDIHFMMPDAPGLLSHGPGKR